MGRRYFFRGDMLTTFFPETPLLRRQKKMFLWGTSPLSVSQIGYSNKNSVRASIYKMSSICLSSYPYLTRLSIYLSSICLSSYLCIHFYIFSSVFYFPRHWTKSFKNTRVSKQNKVTKTIFFLVWRKEN